MSETAIREDIEYAITKLNDSWRSLEQKGQTVELPDIESHMSAASEVEQLQEGLKIPIKTPFSRLAAQGYFTFKGNTYESLTVARESTDPTLQRIGAAATNRLAVCNQALNLLTPPAQS